MTPEQPQSRWLSYALAAGAPLGIYLLWSGRAFDWFSQPVRETDFDSFLVQQGEHPTGLAPSTKGKSKSAASQRGKVSGPFESFLKVDANEEEEDHRNPLDFNSFLKSARQTNKPPLPAPSVPQTKKEPEGPLPHQARVLVMYGTEYGFSREIAEKLFTRLLAEGHYWPVLIDMAEHPVGYDFSQEQAVLIACSTQGDGVPPTEARDFCEWLFAGKAGNLGHLNFSVCALGDKAYTHFCQCGKQLDATLESSGAKRLHDRFDVNKEDWALVDQWSQGVITALATLTLKPVGDAAAGVVKSNNHTAPMTRRWGKSRPYPGRVVALEGLCAVTSMDDKNTFRVEFDLGGSGLTYLPGDALGVYPTNATQYVQELLCVLGAEPTLSIPTPSWHYETSTDGKPATLTLSEALTTCYDIKTPKADLFQVLYQSLPESARLHHPLQGVPKANGVVKASLSNGDHALVEDAETHVTVSNGNGIKASPADAQAQKLAALIAGGSTAQETYLEVGRHVVDVLREFNAAKITPTQLLSTLRQLQPRLYSISSAPLEDPTHVQATIAEVKYHALGAERVGVCSTYVSERIQVGQSVPVYIHKNPDFRLPASPDTPVIMVGPGTGLAPFRSFILQRLLETGRLTGTGTQAPGEMVLFFGCRRSDQDYLYGKDLEAWSQAGHITLHTAFSRQQAQKVYVQDRLREQAASVWQLIDQQGGHFYVCGDASNMAGAVEQELVRIIARKGQGEGEVGAEALSAAQQYLDGLSKAGRYQRDVWY